LQNIFATSFNSFMKHLRRYIIILVLPAVIIPAYYFYKHEKVKQSLKYDLTELSNIRYGMLSVDEWKQVAASAIAGKINELELSGENKAVLRQKISSFLYEVIGDFEVRFYDERSSSLKGILQSGIVAFSGTFEKLKQDVPLFTEQIIDFLEDPQSKEALRSYLVEQLDKYTLETFTQTDYTWHNQIIARHDFENRRATIAGLKKEIDMLERNAWPYKIAIIVLVFAAAMLFMCGKNQSKTEFFIVSGISVSLLIPGVTLPMIEIDARITELSFVLLGEPVSFHDQVLFYQSKSILEVVGIMFGQKSYDLFSVGFLILAFSVLFPAAKLTASILYVYNERMRNSEAIRLLVFKTGKWSMADVMVIAIFMAFIGFNGIITDQLHQMEGLAASVEVLSTNNSGILTGFWFFTSFVLMSLLVSQRLQSGRLGLQPW
jgi:hypothetical protein